MAFMSCSMHQKQPPENTAVCRGAAEADEVRAAAARPAAKARATRRRSEENRGFMVVIRGPPCGGRKPHAMRMKSR